MAENVSVLSESTNMHAQELNEFQVGKCKKIHIQAQPRKSTESQKQGRNLKSSKRKNNSLLTRGPP